MNIHTLFTLTIFLFSSGYSMAQESKVKPFIIEVTSENKTSIDSTLEQSFMDKNIIICSEIHCSKYTLKTRLNYIDFLLEKDELDVVFEEMPFAFSWIVERYLETGDVELLNYVSDMLENLFHVKDCTAGWEISYKTYYQKLRERYISLDSNRKFEYVGIDIIHENLTKVTVYALKIILLKYKNEIQEYSYLENLYKKKKVSVKELVVLCNKLLESLKNVNLSLTDKENIDNILNNIAQTIKVRNKEKERDFFMAKNVLSRVDMTKHGFLHIGKPHLYPSRKSFIDYIANSKIKDKVLVCDFAIYDADKDKQDWFYFKPLTEEDAIKIKASTQKNKLYLMRLNKYPFSFTMLYVK